MKKLLFIGALLVAGATSFGAVTDTFKDADGATSGSNLSAEATLKLNSRGNIIDTTGKATLVVTPIGTEGADGQSLSFTFADAISGQRQNLEGRFTVEIMADNEKLDLPELAKADGQGLSVKLEKMFGVSEDDGKINTNGDILSGLSVVDSGDPAKNLGKLSYSLLGVKTNPKLYTGTVTATLDAAVGQTGTFINKAAQVRVSVNNFTYTPKAED